ncbi:MAG: ABC transporter ATP-binding protein [Nitriliruptoraceae bacterium]|nr:ABC transporter ATP-binding protein [Nitriliruptoraceae bacterium]
MSDARHLPPDDADPAVVFEHVSKRYGRDSWALTAASFTVRAGEIVGLIGPNGAGKSTALALAAGLVRPTAGRCHVLGVDVGGAGRTPAEVGVVVEQPRFVRSLDARANLRMLASVSEVADPDDIDAILDEVGLTRAGTRRVRAYSLGMRQRLGIAQALMERPRLLLLDEPTNGLDPVGIREVRDLLAARARQGTAVVIASHALTELETLCDSALLIHDGRLQAQIHDGDDQALVQIRIAPSDRDHVGSFIDVLDERASPGGTLLLTTTHQPVPELVASLVAADIRIHGIWEHRRTLESLYLDHVTNLA